MKILDTWLKEKSYNIKILFIFMIMFCFGGVFFSHVYAESGKHVNVGSNKVALSGYDTVAYFKENKAVSGDPQYQAQWKGVKWYFSTPGNRDLFKSNPQHYAPQYDGNCAWSVAQGKLAHGNPIVWKIIDDKLYLNFNRPVQVNWEKDARSFIKKADANWPALDH